MKKFIFKDIHFTYSFISMFVFLGLIFALTNTMESYFFAVSFISFFLLIDILERRTKKKRLTVFLNSLVLILGFFIFLLHPPSEIFLSGKTFFNLSCYYFTLVLAIIYRVSPPKFFLGIRTMRSHSSENEWFFLHDIASKLLFLSLFFYLVIVAITDHMILHFLFFSMNLIFNALLSIYLSERFSLRKENS